jgi:hypothetical protein
MFRYDMMLFTILNMCDMYSQFEKSLISVKWWQNIFKIDNYHFVGVEKSDFFCENQSAILKVEFVHNWAQVLKRIVHMPT